ncbi:uncharacterized protein [Gossypium hirsutum]|uniref:Uncharacterized protein n=1 Tax=Gossypium hirsutum TaxID=3635 RepID=A0A1U8NM70_GOSHI|nr:uncharacterized protein LOC107949860 [Gossypium hirsutum]
MPPQKGQTHQHQNPLLPQHASIPNQHVQGHRQQPYTKASTSDSSTIRTIASNLNTRPPGSLPSDTKNPSPRGKEHCKAITLRSDKQTSEPIIDSTVAPQDTDGLITGENVPAQADISLPLPFTERFRKNEHDNQYQLFLDTLKQLQINTPLVDALVQSLTYGKFMKNLLSKKKKLTDIKTIKLTEGCSAILTNKLPLILKDLGSFTIPCSIGNHYLGKDLWDLGDSINLMPLSTFRKLGIGHVKSTTVTLQLVDQSLAQPEGKIKDILVHVDKFIFSANFIILDCEVEKEVLIILGRPFLAIGRTFIDVYNGEVTMQLNDEQVTFSVFEYVQYKDKEECHTFDVLDDLIKEEFNNQSTTFF